ncbi:MAG TPA: hypothetical protein DHU96_13810 [Actinobacteria bacterium]|nr:hypothetical protein [Actinomycetota bacterium]
MSELPDRPDLDQLRRQARELLRAATYGEPRAVTRLRAVSEHVTLSAAQLAVAREYGCRSWPALKAEVERRRRLSESAASPPFPGGDERGALDERWSFGGAAAIETSAGVLFPEALVAGAGHATLYGSLVSSGNGQPAAMPRRLPAPTMLFSRKARLARSRRRQADAATGIMRVLTRSDEVTVVDDRGSGYAFRGGRMSGKVGRSGEPAGHRSVQLGLDPVPARGVGWLELRSQDGAATRLLPSARPAVRVGQLTPVAMSPAERELSDQALSLIALYLGDDAGTREDILGQRCSAALAGAAEIRRSGELDPASELPDQLTQLCAVLTGQRPADGLPAGWSVMLGAARRADGPRHHLDPGTALPPIDGVAVQVDSLISMPGHWRLYLRAMPGWRDSGGDGRRRDLVSVHAEDDLGGRYLSNFGGSGAWPRGREELGLRFLPRLDPLARALKLTFRGASEELAVDLGLGSAARSQRE